ncbi:hypothetical protein FOZ62_020451 [Perkinsus olseni]|uniref:Uncharacterized protein n=1 Tax=Perkinsus olseni TaxID=32597 RepID=A0A7J6SCZ1_PEROL|nr:hypothetical protein FOZ62_020451 [Perkinsus olseni]
MTISPPVTLQQPLRRMSYGQQRLPFTPRTYRIIKRDCEVGFAEASRDIDRMKKGKAAASEGADITPGASQVTRSMPNLHATSRCTTSASSAAPPKRRRPKPLRRRQSSSDFEMDVARKVTVMGRTISETDINRLGNPKVRVLAKIELSRRYKTFDKATLMSIPSQSRGFVDIKTLQRECVRLNASGSSSAAEVLDEWSHRLARGMGRTPIRHRLDAAAARLSGSPSTPSNRHIRIRESSSPSSGIGLRQSATEVKPLSGAVDYIGKNRSAVQWMGEEREKRMGSAFLSRHKPLGIFVSDSGADDEMLEPAGRRGKGLLTRSATAYSRLNAASGSVFKRAKSQSNAVDSAVNHVFMQA